MLLAPLLPGMEQPPHPMRLGDDEKDYYVRGPELLRNPSAFRSEAQTSPPMPVPGCRARRGRS